MKKIIYLCIATLVVQFMTSKALHSQTMSHNFVKTETMLDSLSLHRTAVVQYYDGLGRPDVLAQNGLDPSGK